MNKFRKILLVFMIVTLISGLAVMFGCKSDNKGNGGDAVYSIYVKSMGGLALSDVSVAASSSGRVIAEGTTDGTGKFAFKANRGVYDISVTNLPLGYSLNNASNKTSADSDTLTVLATSSVISDKIPESKVYKVGDVMYDFTITDRSVSGSANTKTYTLSEVLQTKKMVLLNFWNTNCAPCMSELPELELAYRDYQDVAEVFGINVPVLGANTLSDLRTVRSHEYPGEDGDTYSLTFPLALDDNEMPLHFSMKEIPVTVIVDRYGVIAYHIASSMDKASFRNLFEKYSSENYEQDEVTGGGDSSGEGEEKVRVKPNVSQPASSEIEAAINGEGFNGSYYPETEAKDAEFSWPWLVGESNGEKYIHPANHGVGYSFSTISTSLTITPSDISSVNGKVVLVFDLQWSCEDRSDYFYVIVNNSLVYEYTGTEQWGTWQKCFALVADEAGDYKLTLMYVKDDQRDVGQDTVRIKNMRLIKISQIDIPSLDMPRESAREWNGEDFTSYITPVLGDDGFYHKDSKTGPLILADLMNATSFNKRLESDWGISEFAVNGYFDYNKVDEDDPNYKPALDKTDAIAKWAQAANNSELPGLTPVGVELKDLLDEFIKTRVGTFRDNMWLELCKYFDHYGTDTDDKGICDSRRNPIRGLLSETALPTVAAYDGELDLNNIPSEYKNKVVWDRPIVPRGLKYLFVPEKSGVYRFRSQSQYLSDTMCWLTDYDGNYLVTTDEQLENPDKEYNFVITYYLKAGQKYIVRTCLADVGGTGEYTFTAEYLGASAYVWQFASRNYFTGVEDDLSAVANYMNVLPVIYGDYVYNAMKDAEGNYVFGENGEPIANRNDPIYVDFLSGARFFDNGSLELCFEYGDIDKIRKTLRENVFTEVWNKTEPSGGWAPTTTLEEIKGSALNDDDWSSIISRLLAIYGENVYIDQEEMIALLVECKTLGQVAAYLQEYYLSFFDLTYYSEYFAQFGVAAERCKDYTDLVRGYYEQAKLNQGDPAKGYADKGCVRLTTELMDALDMFSKRMGGFPALSTDWMRLCAHYEYMGPAQAD